ncbi:SHOCT domain-containing protein [Natrinema salifodinae]|uniref:Short C-terminal domain-containing protein n=1 Tax=Natrinema salifodinae TaxID=1202768 RepID=A0A1I0M685_9EURY|nr:SHOCT domain-containing protein [Natrinema salifodinae]SEV83454.1 Short C-terminal domain-containing protein [Natrinema salifodinae]
MDGRASEGGGDDRERPEDDPRTRLRENATSIASVLVTAIWLGAMFTGQSWWLAALLVGYVAVVPVVAMLFGDEDDRSEWVDEDTNATHTGPAETNTGADTRDALETLRERYAAGKLTDEQFERKLERLLNTETIEDARTWARDRDRNRDRDREQEQEQERVSARERDLEYER